MGAEVRLHFSLQWKVMQEKRKSDELIMYVELKVRMNE